MTTQTHPKTTEDENVEADKNQLRDDLLEAESNLRSDLDDDDHRDIDQPKYAYARIIDIKSTRNNSILCEIMLDTGATGLTEVIIVERFKNKLEIDSLAEAPDKEIPVKHYKDNKYNIEYREATPLDLSNFSIFMLIITLIMSISTIQYVGFMSGALLLFFVWSIIYYIHYRLNVAPWSGLSWEN